MQFNKYTHTHTHTPQAQADERITPPPPLPLPLPLPLPPLVCVDHDGGRRGRPTASARPHQAAADEHEERVPCHESHFHPGGLQHACGGAGVLVDHQRVRPGPEGGLQRPSRPEDVRVAPPGGHARCRGEVPSLMAAPRPPKPPPPLFSISVQCFVFFCYVVVHLVARVV